MVTSVREVSANKVQYSVLPQISSEVTVPVLENARHNVFFGFGYMEIPFRVTRAWGESTTIVLVLRAFKRVKAQVCECSPLQVEEMRADKGYVTTSNTSEEGNTKGSRGVRRRERRVGIGHKQRT